MSYLPDEVAVDDTIDTQNMDPEQDFAPINDPSVPRKVPTDNTNSRDLEADQFNQNGNLPNAFSQPVNEKFKPASQVEPELIGAVDPSSLPAAPAQNQEPAVDPAESEAAADDYEFSPELLKAAGLSANEVGDNTSFETPEQLQAAVRYLDTRFVTQGRSLQQAPAAEYSETDDIVVEAEEEWELPKPEETDNWDPDTIKLVNALNERSDAQLALRDEKIKEQQDFIEHFVQTQQQQEAIRQLDEFDSLVNSLPDDWTPLLGRGTAHELNPQGMAFNNRVHLEQTMQALQNGNAQSGRGPIPTDELMVRSLAVAFPEQQQVVVRNRVISDVESRQQLITNRPTQRREAAMTTDQKAGRTAQDWYKKHNMLDPDVEIDVL